MVPFLHTLYPTFQPIAPSYPLSHPISFLQSFFTLNSSPLSLSHFFPLTFSFHFFSSIDDSKLSQIPALTLLPLPTPLQKTISPDSQKLPPICTYSTPKRACQTFLPLYRSLPDSPLLTTSSSPLLYFYTFLPSPIFLSPYPSLSKFQSQGHSTRYINLFPHPKLMYVSLPLSFSLNPSLPLLDFLSLPHAFFFLLILPRLPISSITSKGHVCKVD